MSSPPFKVPGVPPQRSSVPRRPSLRMLPDDPPDDPPDVSPNDPADGATVCSALQSCDGMIADVDREIASVQADQQDRAIPVVSGEYVETRGLYRIHRLTTDGPVPPLRQEQWILVECSDGVQVAGQVISADEKNVIVAVTDEVDDAAWSGSRIVIDDLWLLERLRARLIGIREPLARGVVPADFDIDLAQLAIGEGNFEANALIAPADTHDPLLDHLNERQQEAIRTSLGRRVTYLWGPPGTGKTTTLATLIHAQILSGRRVLVVAPSNAAADVLAMALASRLSAMPQFQRGLLVRVGPRPTRELRARYGSHAVPQDIVVRLAEEEFGPRREALQGEIAELEALGSGEGASSAHRGALRRLMDAQAALQRLAQDEVAFLDLRFDDLLEHCRALVTPVHNVYLSRMIRGRFDTVVVDEASMVLVPQLFLAAGLAGGGGGTSKGQVIIAGDFQQLPGPVVHRVAEEVPWLARDVFSRVGIPDDVAREDDPDYLVMLTEQYRMAPAICDLISDLFYMNRLTTAAEVRRRAVPGPAWLGSLVLLDTSALHPRAAVPSGTHSRVNTVHADLVKDLVRMLGTVGGIGASEDLLVLSPYTTQVALLHSTLAEERRQLETRLRVMTVHRAQGAEAGTVIVSIDDALGAPLTQFMRARDWRSTGSRLLNVAISRARDRVVLLADVVYLERTAGPVVQRVIKALRERGQVIGPGDICSRRCDSQST